MSLFLLIRPYQVNPQYQFLNLPGGVGKINSIKEIDSKIYVDNKVIIPITNYTLFGAAAFDEGNIVELLQNDKFILKQIFG